MMTTKKVFRCDHNQCEEWSEKPADVDAYPLDWRRVTIERMEPGEQSFRSVTVDLCPIHARKILAFNG